MKAIKDIEFIKLNSYSGFYWVSILNPKEYALDHGSVFKEFATKKSAINHWKIFAKLNGIKNCKIKE